MHNAKLKYVAFDERSFKNGPVLLDDGAYTHFLTPDEDDFLPVLKNLPEGDYSLFVSSRESQFGLLLVFSLYDSASRKVATRSLSVSGQACRMPGYATSQEREQFRDLIYASSCEKVMVDWFEDYDHEFFDTLGAFTRVVIEDSYGDILTSYDGEAEKFVGLNVLHTTH